MTDACAMHGPVYLRRVVCGPAQRMTCRSVAVQGVQMSRELREVVREMLERIEQEADPARRRTLQAKLRSVLGPERYRAVVGEPEAGEQAANGEAGMPGQSDSGSEEEEALDGGASSSSESEEDGEAGAPRGAPGSAGSGEQSSDEEEDAELERQHAARQVRLAFTAAQLSNALHLP